MTLSVTVLVKEQRRAWAVGDGMTPKKLAAVLDGREYGSEVTPEIKLRARAHGLVIVFGASDDLIEFDGAIYDEGDGDGDHLVDEQGLVTRDEDASDDEIAAFVARRHAARTITANWAEEGYSWTYTTDIPHETFDIMEDGERYCRGLVFRLADLAGS